MNIAKLKLYKMAMKTDTDQQAVKNREYLTIGPLWNKKHISPGEH